MLGKLIKQELKVTSRLFIPLYIALGVMTLLVKLTSGTTFGHNAIFGAEPQNTIMNLITGLLIMVYIFVIIGIVLLTYFIIIRRFYTNMFGDEGYLMFTLPVTTGQLMNSKLIVAFIWQFVMVPAMLLSFFILFVNTEVLQGMPYLFSRIGAELNVLETSGFHIGLLAAELLGSLLISMCSTILVFYLSITLGQHFFPNRRLLGSILAFLGINTLESFLSSLLGIFGSNLLTNTFHMMQVTPSDMFGFLHTLLPVSMLLEIGIAVIYYFATHYMLSKKLNLE